MKLYLILFFLILVSSCKNNNSSEPISESNKKEVDGKELKDLNWKLANEPKIFLKFWEGMRIREYTEVMKLLVENKTLEDVGIFGAYRTGACPPAIMNPIFEDNKLVRLEVNGGECLYSLFKEKYNLPSLVERKYYKTNLNNLKAKSDTRLYKEKVLPQYKPLVYEEGEIVKRGSVIIRIEHFAHKLTRTGILKNEKANFGNGFPPYGDSLGDIIFTYMTKDQFSKEDDKMQKAVKLFYDRAKEQQTRENVSKDEI